MRYFPSSGGEMMQRQIIIMHNECRKSYILSQVRDREPMSPPGTHRVTPTITCYPFGLQFISPVSFASFFQLLTVISQFLWSCWFADNSQSIQYGSFRSAFSFIFGAWGDVKGDRRVNLPLPESFSWDSPSKLCHVMIGFTTSDGRYGFVHTHIFEMSFILNFRLEEGNFRLRVGKQGQRVNCKHIVNSIIILKTFVYIGRKKKGWISFGFLRPCPKTNFFRLTFE